ncbi:hypothetical protein LIER_05941 [Lithospermum erythrorhizon]|uniref:Protein SirB1 N-terminal domain-containing protein n=1 Tax=Lithospermum erythrorhizon TaxID=34254 RepID=A0AAV3P409_LITER
MLCSSVSFVCNQETMMVHGASINCHFLGIYGRCGIDLQSGSWFENEKEKRNKQIAISTNIAKIKNKRLSISPLASSSAMAKTQSSSSRAELYLEVRKAARERYTAEISFQSKDKDISLAKALLYIAAEDEAFSAIKQEMDAQSFRSERRGMSLPNDALEWDSIESMPLSGKNINEWLAEIDTIAEEVKAELVPREIGCDLIEVLDAVNLVLFESRGFKRLPLPLASKCAYLHSVLNSGHCSAILFSIIYIEVCRRLNLTILGSRVGEDFLIWPQTGYPEKLFKVTSGNSIFKVVNGSCVEDPRSKASDINSNTLSGLEIASNRDIIGIALANLIRLHWKRASRSNHGLMLTSPLRSVHIDNDKFSNCDGSKVPLLRPQDLRLAIMASERLLVLQPHNWALRRDHGMMLYYRRDYAEAVQELSICMAFAPEEEAEVLEPFIEKLHLLQLESSWKSLGQKGRLIVP